VEFKEFANEWMKQFFMEPASAENCEKMSKLVYTYLWEHPEFAEHREAIEMFWDKVGRAWDTISESYHTDPKPCNLSASAEVCSDKR